MEKVLLISLLLFSPLCMSQEKIYRFGFIAKESRSSFFKEIERGCMARAKELPNVECHFAKMEEANPRVQEIKLFEFMDKYKVDGLALTVINSEYMQRSIHKHVPKDFPIVTVDADFSKKVLKAEPNLRAAYIGTNNYELGFQLGELYKKSNAGGINSEYCVISGHSYTFNLNERVRGFNESLKNANGEIFTQNPRCPLYCLENSPRAISQMDHIFSVSLEKMKKSSVIFMGGWAQLSTKAYIETISSYKKYLKNGKLFSFSSDAQPAQMDLLRDGLSSGNIGQNPYKMGYDAIDILLDLVKGKKIKKVYSTGVVVCTPKNYKNCH
ncbi:hypothetical protein A9Q84_06810 [Halobacteriovorax marinus]|mgnify:CR=1 FL=1|uniref:Periplasmic binding protein domain-containing protein n=1 Tax=Halobacteriovorax marinus TaxID=97084 RepID=A0A1Y5F9U3_9BACT|nr:hypothetical protein A9Q84_06810 [Halobacteriovorax marinus]